MLWWYYAVNVMLYCGYDAMNPLMIKYDDYFQYICGGSCSSIEYRLILWWWWWSIMDEDDDDDNNNNDDDDDYNNNNDDDDDDDDDDEDDVDADVDDNIC